jgi:hypothetical protein
MSMYSVSENDTDLFADHLHSQDIDFSCLGDATLDGYYSKQLTILERGDGRQGNPG